MRPLQLICNRYITYNKYIFTKRRNSDDNFWIHQFHRGKQISEKVPNNRFIFRQQSTCRRQVLKRNYTTGASLETSSRPSGMNCTANENLCPQHKIQQNCSCSHITHLVPQLHDGECQIKLNFVNWYFQGAYVGENGHTLIR